MKPSGIQYFMASHLGKIAGGTGACIGASCVLMNTVLEPSQYIGDMAALFGFLLAALSALGAGFLLGFMIFGRLLFLIFRMLNGGPFRKDDTVRILTGPHRDRVTRVYDVWDSRGQVRVELDEQAKKDVTDVFSVYEVCREDPSLRSGRHA